jgi:hypothetical protein
MKLRKYRICYKECAARYEGSQEDFTEGGVRLHDPAKSRPADFYQDIRYAAIRNR